jgi:hypothetical protein
VADAWSVIEWVPLVPTSAGRPATSTPVAETCPWASAGAATASIAARTAIGTNNLFAILVKVAAVAMRFIFRLLLLLAWPIRDCVLGFCGAWVTKRPQFGNVSAVVLIFHPFGLASPPKG